MINRLRNRSLPPVIEFLTISGGLLLLFICLWISYGVFVRYVLQNPDRMVTEATSLLLLPLAFVGMPYALHHNAFPRVTLLIDRLPPRIKALVEAVNLLLMTLSGGVVTIVAGVAFVRSYQAGTVSYIISWPEWALWVPVTLFIGTFTWYSCLKLLSIVLRNFGPRRNVE